MARRPADGPSFLEDAPEPGRTVENREFREFTMDCEVQARESSISGGLTPWPGACSGQTDDAPLENAFGQTSRTLVARRHHHRDIAMLRMERSANGPDVCFTIIGRNEAAHVAELRRLIDEETAVHRLLVLDLE